MKNVPIQQLMAENALLISNISQGFQHYPYKVLYHTADEYLKLLKHMTAINSPGHSYVDFYFGRLSEEEKNRICSRICPSWQSAIHSLKLSPDQIYFQLEDEHDLFLEILSGLSAEELLFSTFYFTKYPCTLWTNYGLKYPLFYQSEKHLQHYGGIG